MKIQYKILNLIFKNIKPFCLEYERMNGSTFIIGIRYNRFVKEGTLGLVNSLGFFYGYKYKVIQWI